MWFYRTLCWLNAFCEFCPPSADSIRFCPPSAEGMHSTTTFYWRTFLPSPNTFLPSLSKNKMLMKEFTGRVAPIGLISNYLSPFYWWDAFLKKRYIFHSESPTKLRTWRHLKKNTKRMLFMDVFFYLFAFYDHLSPLYHYRKRIEMSLMRFQQMVQFMILISPPLILVLRHA